MEVEVTNISLNGLWLMIGGEEKFLSFDQFPWFRDANVRQILAVQMSGEEHLYWPELDVDLSVESIDHPEKFPLMSKTATVADEPIVR